MRHATCIDTQTHQIYTSHRHKQTHADSRRHTDDGDRHADRQRQAQSKAHTDMQTQQTQADKQTHRHTQRDAHRHERTHAGTRRYAETHRHSQTHTDRHNQIQTDRDRHRQRDLAGALRYTLTNRRAGKERDGDTDKRTRRYNLTRIDTSDTEKQGHTQRYRRTHRDIDRHIGARRGTDRQR